MFRTTFSSGAALILVTTLCAPPTGARAEGEASAPRGAAVTVLKAAKSCFADNVEISGILIAHEEIPVQVSREGLRVTDTLVDPGDVVTAGQPLAKLAAPDGSAATLNAPAAGIVSVSRATIGAMASMRAEPLYQIISQGDFDLVAQAPALDLSKIKRDQTATIKIVGSGEVTGKVRQVPLGPSSAPHGVIQAKDGTAWITDGGQNAIVRYDPKTEKIDVWKLPESSGYANLNTGAFDPYPFPLLAVALAMVSLILTSFVLIRQNRMSRRADLRNHLALQINLLAEQESTEILQVLQKLSRRLGIAEAVDRDTEELALDAPIEQIARNLRENIDEAGKPR